MRAWPGDRPLYPAPAADDDELDAFISASLVSIWHPVGTCRMGRSADAVVSPHLDVHGLENLFVADASVMPAITRGNTHAPRSSSPRRPLTSSQQQGAS